MNYITYTLPTKTTLILILLLQFVGLVGQDNNSNNEKWESGLWVINSDQPAIDSISIKNLIIGKDTSSYLINQNGDSLDYTFFRDKVVLIDFWFLACKPCIAEITGYDILTSKFRDKPFMVLSIGLDPKKEIAEKLTSKREFKFPIISNKKLTIPTVYPLRILVDRNGNVRKIKVGGTINPDAHLKLVEEFEPIINKWIKIK